jgi:hypothetical protein
MLLIILGSKAEISDYQTDNEKKFNYTPKITSSLPNFRLISRTRQKLHEEELVVNSYTLFRHYTLDNVRFNYGAIN